MCEECPTLRKTRFELNSAGNDIERDDLVYSINEPDNYAVEEALQIVAESAGTSPSPRSAAKRTKRSCAGRWRWAPTKAC